MLRNGYDSLLDNFTLTELTVDCHHLYETIWESKVKIFWRYSVNSQLMKSLALCCLKCAILHCFAVYCSWLCWKLSIKMFFVFILKFLNNLLYSSLKHICRIVLSLSNTLIQSVMENYFSQPLSKKFTFLFSISPHKCTSLRGYSKIEKNDNG